MSKELDALAKIKDKLEIWDCSEESNWEEYGTGYYECEEELDIIETALKDYEHSQQQRELYFKQAKELKSIELDNKKKLKALEIIKEKKWLVEDILNAFIEDKEKCDLLKEVLG